MSITNIFNYDGEHGTKADWVIFNGKYKEMTNEDFFLGKSEFDYGVSAVHFKFDTLEDAVSELPKTIKYDLDMYYDESATETEYNDRITITGIDEETAYHGRFAFYIGEDSSPLYTTDDEATIMLSSSIHLRLAGANLIAYSGRYRQETGDDWPGLMIGYHYSIVGRDYIALSGHVRQTIDLPYPIFSSRIEAEEYIANGDLTNALNYDSAAPKEEDIFTRSYYYNMPLYKNGTLYENRSFNVQTNYKIAGYNNNVPFLYKGIL